MYVRTYLPPNSEGKQKNRTMEIYKNDVRFYTYKWYILCVIMIYRKKDIKSPAVAEH